MVTTLLGMLAAQAGQFDDMKYLTNQKPLSSYTCFGECMGSTTFYYPETKKTVTVQLPINEWEGDDTQVWVGERNEWYLDNEPVYMDANGDCYKINDSFVSGIGETRTIDFYSTEQCDTVKELLSSLPLDEIVTLQDSMDGQRWINLMGDSYDDHPYYDRKGPGIVEAGDFQHQTRYCEDLGKEIDDALKENFGTSGTHVRYGREAPHFIDSVIDNGDCERFSEQESPMLPELERFDFSDLKRYL